MATKKYMMLDKQRPNGAVAGFSERVTGRLH